jgi:hypothetical protein
VVDVQLLATISFGDTAISRGSRRNFVIRPRHPSDANDMLGQTFSSLAASKQLAKNRLRATDHGLRDERRVVV